MRGLDWIQTYTGRAFWPLDPRPGDVCIEDIAHALSNLCRYTGHCKEFYSVAQHSVLVSEYIEQVGPSVKEMPHLHLWALLHDASEAYLHDLPRPLKHAPGFGDLYRKYETALMRVICQHFGLDPKEPGEVREADTVLLMTEVRDLLGEKPMPWKDPVNGAGFTAQPMDRHIFPWIPSVAEKIFLSRFEMIVTFVGAPVGQ